MDLADGRVTDALASSAEILFHDVELQALDDGRFLAADSACRRLGRAMRCRGGRPSGRPVPSVRTIEQTLSAEIGPYRITAEVHTMPTADLLTSIIRRGPILAMTDALIEVRLAGERIQHKAGVLAVVVGQISSLQRTVGRPSGVELEVEVAG
jgi:hypothetical protein